MGVLHSKGRLTSSCGDWQSASELKNPDGDMDTSSPGDRSRDKFDFYRQVNVREVLIVDRDPWLLELYQNLSGDFKMVGSSSVKKPALLSSCVFPLTFTLCNGLYRPLIQIATSDGKQHWFA